MHIKIYIEIDGTVTISDLPLDLLPLVKALNPDEIDGLAAPEELLSKYSKMETAHGSKIFATSFTATDKS